MQKLTEIKNRIKSVSDTRKITGAMEMISIAKARKAEAQRAAYEPFFEKCFAVASAAAASDAVSGNRYCMPASDKARTLLIVVASNKGLAGAFNSSVLKAAEAALSSAPNAAVFSVGLAVKEYFAHKGYPIEADFSDCAGSLSLLDARKISDAALMLFDGKGGVGRVEIIYTHDKKAAEVVTRTLLPIEASKDASAAAEFDPAPEAVLKEMVPVYLGYAVHGALLESAAAEHRARRAAMNNAGRNAGEILGELTLSYHRARQESVTTELTEIVATGLGVRK
jgi:F-type H+-transporting ATPase subunit gamma